MNNRNTGACGCGAVRFTISGPLRGVVYCHCTQCRRQSGHFYAATEVDDDRIEVEGKENITWYRSSRAARRGFCGVCGSALFWKFDELNSVSVMAGAFDAPADLGGDCHIFVADKGDYYEINDDLPQFSKSSPDVKVADE